SKTQQEPEKIPETLAKNAKAQLEKEIRMIENWLKDLEETRDDNSASIIARSSYTEMLQNRQELLNTLTEL
ncbi:hypothetical protein JYT97_04040, partial [Haliea sp. AH-315-K21]|nr:hypothetical protein [Haliea sp. AH-315-K21]